MSAPSPLPLLKDFSDWHSPMVVKELRHGLRTRFFSVALIQFHVLLVLLLSSVLVGADEKVIHGLFWGLTMLLILGVMPARGFSALTAEVTGGTLEMLRLTNMPALRVIFGKWAALFSQTLLVASSLLPYMVARYFLGGVEIATEAAGLAMMLLASALMTAAVVAFSSQKSVLLRLMLLCGVFAPAIPLVVLVLNFVIESRGRLTRAFTGLTLPEWLGSGAGAVVATVYGVYLFLALGASRFASPAENHSTRKRLVGLVMMALLGAGGAALAHLHPNKDAAIWIFIPTLIFVLILGMDVMTERMPSVATVAAPFASSRWRRLAGRFLYPGWASGVFYYILICLAPVVIMAFISFRSGDPEGLFITLCWLTANVVPVPFLAERDKPFLWWWMIQLLVFVLAILLAILAQVSRIKALGWWGVVSPGTAAFGTQTVDYSSRDELWIAGALSGGAWLLLAALLAARGAAIYRCLEEELLVISHSPNPPAHDSE